ncbi:hypothetical protein MMC08_000103 [Hypocenomyce scalaris]|nr:hypothetical protein [Hypocenomyce scalaris]
MSIALVTAIPQTSPSNTSSLNVDDPSAADPTTPPTTLTAPSKAPNPWASGGIPTVPSACADPSNPSDDCFNALSVQAQNGVNTLGGYLSHDGSCSSTQEGQLETAAWDASTLANYASDWPANGRGIAAGIFYIGPDYSTQQQRISARQMQPSRKKPTNQPIPPDNFGRAAAFKITGNSYITTSCQDTKNWCNVKKDGKAISGYAWTINGWFRYYHYITLCPAFFTLDSLATQLETHEEELAHGDTSKVVDMQYLKSTGQFFLHEMMHTQLVGQPHIIDERVQQDGLGPWAYSPLLVYKLASQALNQGGGATRASTNADSYAVLSNALYWWDVTGYFPGVPGKNNPTETSSNATLVESPIALYLDIGNATNVSSIDFTDLLNADFIGFTDSAATSTSSSPPSTIPTPTSSPSLPTPSSAPPAAGTDSCSDWYKFLYDSFQIRGSNFNASTFDTDGSDLKIQLIGFVAL